MIKKAGYEQRIYKMFIKMLFFISPYFAITYKMPESEKLTDILLKGCTAVVDLSWV
jgi:hypothetical protein